MSTIPNLLRQNQIQDNTEEVRRLQGTIDSPHSQDKSLARRQLNVIKHELDTLSPATYNSTEIDNAVYQEVELREAMLEGMPTQEEMRRAPPGAVGKHQRWEAKNKSSLLAWKHIVMRINAGDTDPDIANFERFRPAGGSGQMNMDNAIVEKTRITNVPVATAPPVMFDATEIAALRDLDSDLAEQLAMLDNEGREQVKQVLLKFLNPPTPVEEPITRDPTAWDALRGEAKALGIKAFGKTKEALTAEVAAAKAA